ncbi:peroxide stress protein YaaA [Sphingomonas sp. DT-51]|uniref:peroxide stress protein YaaA n=1 Tax=Sphingomonas sp. DT-51 TaxID=3396165 RepID=UPI003F192D76
MIAVLSPAKTLDLETPPPFPATPARFAEEAATLAHAAAHLTQKKLGELMKISPALAKLNADRFRDFDAADERPALYTFAGDVYAGFEAKTLDETAVRFAQDHVRLLSGLYGILRPLDGIRPYRLEMGTRWAPRKKKLTDWWDDRVAVALAEDLAAEGSGVVLNLASQEYWEVVADRLPAGVRVIAVDFREADGRFVSFHAKKARGMMARYLVEHHVAELDGMKAFDTAGYRFAPDQSEDARWTFERAA